ncbi:MULTISPECIES: M61 family metallopeptidase [Sphingomonas]|uniref:M61 family metallopeptidase n=1 Tax=Sphingomonas TaxID=13687 RepID=UPI000DF01710|nr:MULTISPECIES: PDZ domain-containing protein [Sphingomonas]
MVRSTRSAALFFAAPLAIAAASPVPPQNSRPQPVPIVDTIPTARDIPYPGTLQLTVDATDTARGIFRIKERVPVAQAGDLVLLYPKWLPGNHAPSGQISKVAGFRPTANGQVLKWRRDPVDVYAFHVDVPQGVSAVDVEFQYVSPTDTNQGRTVMTPDMASIQWIANSLYPAGYFVRQIPIQASVIVPADWKIGTALRPQAQSGGRTDYPVTSYEILMDSPLIAGRNYRNIPLTNDVSIDVIGDTPADLAATPAQIAAHRRLVEQAVKLFGAQHYDHYNFLLTISDNLGGSGLEHHRSSEDGVKRGYFTDWDNVLRDRNLLPHEYSHSWDGKYRRGADLWTPDYRTPMQGTYLWVYEGMTQFWGYVLGARSGMLSKQDTLDALAATAATYSEGTPGRAWRPLVDTTNDPTIAQRSPQAWRGWQRSEDYYSEGQLIWTDVDRIIRTRSNGRKSIDDFARSFFGMRDRDYGELTYTLDEIVQRLNAVVPYDWRGYLTAKVYDVAAKAPLEGLTEGGYNLVYTDQPTKWIKNGEARAKSTDLTYSGGFAVGSDGKISSVLWDSAAFNAGLAIGDQLLAVNGRGFSGDALKTAITAAKGSPTTPIDLLIKSGDLYRTARLEWHGGLRYPRLVKVGRGMGTLDHLLEPK